jgi:hypothetical protein
VRELLASVGAFTGAGADFQNNITKLAVQVQSQRPSTVSCQIPHCGAVLPIVICLVLVIPTEAEGAIVAGVWV